LEDCGVSIFDIGGIGGGVRGVAWQENATIQYSGNEMMFIHGT